MIIIKIKEVQESSKVLTRFKEIRRDWATNVTLITTGELEQERIRSGAITITFRDEPLNSF